MDNTTHPILPEQSMQVWDRQQPTHWRSSRKTSHSMDDHGVFYFRIVQSTTDHTFNACGRYFISPGIYTRQKGATAFCVSERHQQSGVNGIAKVPKQLYQDSNPGLTARSTVMRLNHCTTAPSLIYMVLRSADCLANATKSHRNGLPETIHENTKYRKQTRYCECNFLFRLKTHQ